VASLCRKYQKAVAAVGTMSSAVEQLTKSIGNSHWISEWKKLEKAAGTKRGEALMIYNVSHTPGMFSTPTIFSSTYNGHSPITSKETTGPHGDWEERQAHSVVIGGSKPRS